MAGAALRSFDRRGQPIDIATHDRLLYDEAYCLVARDVIHGVTVSTVWTGVPAPCLDPSSPPLIFQTAAFGAEVEEVFCRRYATETDAIAGHAEVVAEFRGART